MSNKLKCFSLEFGKSSLSRASFLELSKGSRSYNCSSRLTGSWMLWLFSSLNFLTLCEWQGRHVLPWQKTGMIPKQDLQCLWWLFCPSTDHTVDRCVEYGTCLPIQTSLSSIIWINLSNDILVSFKLHGKPTQSWSTQGVPIFTETLKCLSMVTSFITGIPSTSMFVLVATHIAPLTSLWSNLNQWEYI